MTVNPESDSIYHRRNPAAMGGALIVLTAAILHGALEAGESPQPREKPFWSLAPLAMPAVPGTSENPIDAFILEKLEGRNSGLSKEADRRTLIRRVSYDLTGLPPAPEEVEAFASNKHPGAWEQLIERLLASPRYGEHWARHWLDVANYADTHGNDHDYARWNAWPYRDYVIHAFNDDKPYSRFVQEQVAGDVLFPDDPQATVALGFVAAGPWDHTLMVTVREDTVDHRMAQNLDRDSMVSTVMGTFQSLTIHCARCHDHKFDPVTQKEYYALQAVFAGVDRADRPFDRDAGTRTERARVLAQKRSLENRDATLPDTPDTAKMVAAWETSLLQREKAWAPFEIVSVLSTAGAMLTRQEDGSWLAGGDRPVRDSYIVTARRKAGKLSAVRLEVLPDERLPQRGPGRWDNGNFHLSEFRAFAASPSSGGSATPLTFSRASADYDEGPSISAAQAIDGKNETHWGVHPRYGEPHEAVFEIKDPAAFADGTTFTLLLEFQAGAQGHGIGRFRLSACDDAPSAILAPVPPGISAILRVPAGERTPSQRRELAVAVLTQENQRALAALPAPQAVYAITRDFPPDGENFKPSPQPRPIHVLARGDLNSPGDVIGPGALSCIRGMPADLAIADPGDEAGRRAALARWLTDDRNALTWRSIVNRVWHYHFGRGLCDTPNDFGKMGGTPSHPELLDWLAVWFRDEARGSLKKLHRLIMTSATYRQSSRSTVPVEPDNRLLSHMNRTRLTAEQLRDSLLQLSGQLDLTMGGPSAVQFVHRGKATFNPDGGAITPVRSQSTTAIQAFALLNNAFVIRQCELIAARAANVPQMFRLLLQREPTREEATRFTDYAQQHGLPNACHVIINSNEFLHLD